MGRQKLGARVNGPYERRDGRTGVVTWRVVVYRADGSREDFKAGTRKAAEAIAGEARATLAATEVQSIEDAIKKYDAHLTEKGNKPGSISLTLHRLRFFFTGAHAIAALTPQRAAALYKSLRDKRTSKGSARYSVDTHRNMLAEARTFLKWCVSRRWLAKNPLEGTEGTGRRRHGKAQLRIDEVRAWEKVAFEQADDGEEGAVAALMAFYLGMRSSEVVSRVVRDLDDEGRRLWIPDAKTEAGKRPLEVPARLQALLLALGEGKARDAFLFPHRLKRGKHRERRWVTAWAKRICRLAKVPLVPAHGLRGTAASVAMEAGQNAHLLATWLGHESATTTMESYARREAIEKAHQRKLMKVIDGGKKR